MVQRQKMSYYDAINLHVGDCVGIDGIMEYATVMRTNRILIKVEDFVKTQRHMLELEISVSYFGAGEFKEERIWIVLDLAKPNSLQNRLALEHLQRFVYPDSDEYPEW